MANLPLDYIWAALTIPRSPFFDLMYVAVGVFPCIAWLWFYLRQDKHPEPKSEILAVFFLGALITIPAVYIELFLTNDCRGLADSCSPGIFYQLGLPPLATLVVSNIIGIAFVEEFFKYAVVWLKEQSINGNWQLDEPLDFVMYMVISAMGFAAVENLLFLFLIPQIETAFIASLVRSVTAILVHALCSGILGYYMAMTFCHRDKKIRYLVGGIALVSLLHGLYDLSIIGSEENIEFLPAMLVLIALMGTLLYKKIEKLKGMKSVCDMKLK